MNPCAVDNPCAPTAECTVDNHRAQCKCPPGFTGDPYSQCVPIFDGECKVDPDCPDNRACIEHQCLDPCIEYDPCGKAALCETTSHRATCRCPTGWAGDPHTECYNCKLIIYEYLKLPLLLHIFKTILVIVQKNTQSLFFHQFECFLSRKMQILQNKKKSFDFDLNF